MKTKKLISLLIAFVLCVGTAPVTMAASPEDTALRVNSGETAFPSKLDLREKGYV